MIRLSLFKRNDGDVNFYSRRKYPGLVLPKHTPVGDFRKEHINCAVKAYRGSEASIVEQIDRIAVTRRSGSARALLATYVGALQNPILGSYNLHRLWVLEGGGQLAWPLLEMQIKWSNIALETLIDSRPRDFLLSEASKKSQEYQYEKHSSNMSKVLHAAGNYRWWTAENITLAKAFTSYDLDGEFSEAFQQNQNIPEQLKVMLGLL